MENLLVYVALAGIVGLILINLTIVFSTVAINQLDHYNDKVYQKTYRQIEPIIAASIDDPIQLVRKLELVKTRVEKKAVFDSLMNYVQDSTTSKNSVNVLEKLGFIDKLISEASKKLSLRHIQLFSQLRYNKVVPLLMKGTESKNFEISYNSFYALSFFTMSQKELSIYVSALLKTSIIRDRKVDMLNHLHIDVKKLLYFLAEFTMDEQKVILLLVLKNRLKKQDVILANQLLPYLDGEKEIRIATIQVLTSSGNENYFSHLKELYEKESDWQVRAVLSKNLPDLHAPEEQNLLIEMLNDENWWVRHNAITTLKKRYPDSKNNKFIELVNEDESLKNL